MHVVCPACGTEFPIEAGLLEGDGKKLAAVLADMEPVLGRACIAYLRLFKPAKTALRMARAAKLAAELQALATAGSVCRDERSNVQRAATPATWTAGIEQMLAQRAALVLPLDSHAYLRAVVFGIADKADAAIERQKEANIRVGKTPDRLSSNSATAAGETPLQAALAVLANEREFGTLTAEAYESECAKARERLGEKP